MDRPGLLAGVSDAYSLSPVELAAALNVTSGQLDAFAAGSDQPELGERLAKLARLATSNISYVCAGHEWNGRAILIPTEPWTPIFKPSGMFRLPVNIEWSGTDQQRWRDARDLDSLLDGYLLVLTYGRLHDMLAWVDVGLVATHADELPWPRASEAAWKAQLEAWQLANV